MVRYEFGRPGQPGRLVRIGERLLYDEGFQGLLKPVPRKLCLRGGNGLRVGLPELGRPEFDEHPGAKVVRNRTATLGDAGCGVQGDGRPDRVDRVGVEAPVGENSAAASAPSISKRAGPLYSSAVPESWKSAATQNVSRSRSVSPSQRAASAPSR